MHRLVRTQVTRELELREATAHRGLCRCGCGRPRTHGLWMPGADPGAPAAATGCEWSMRLALRTGLDALGRLERSAHDRLVGQPETWAREHWPDSA